jgi:hypothetical protein
MRSVSGFGCILDESLVFERGDKHLFGSKIPAEMFWLHNQALS